MHLQIASCIQLRGGFLRQEQDRLAAAMAMAMLSWQLLASCTHSAVSRRALQITPAQPSLHGSVPGFQLGSFSSPFVRLSLNHSSSSASVGCASAGCALQPGRTAAASKSSNAAAALLSRAPGRWEHAGAKGQHIPIEVQLFV